MFCFFLLHQGIKYFLLPRGKDVKTGVIWQGAEKVKSMQEVHTFTSAFQRNR